MPKSKLARSRRIPKEGKVAGREGSSLVVDILWSTAKGIGLRA